MNARVPSVPPEAALETLWRLNHAYGQRLAHARAQLQLLDQLLQTRQAGTNDAPYPLLRRLDESLGVLYEHHRRWRYRYFYENGDEKRMVQEEDAVGRAMAHFIRLRARHDLVLDECTALMADAQRPSVALTRVTASDLWDRLGESLDALRRFDESPTP